MNKYDELLKMFLPEGIFEYFEYEKAESGENGIKVTLMEHSWVPELPEEHKGKRVTSKGFKNFLVEDFPVRGKKVQLLLKRRVWKIEGVKELLKRKIPIVFPGTKLENNFGIFLKGGNRKGTC